MRAMILFCLLGGMARFPLQAQPTSVEGIYLSLTLPYQNTQGDLNGNTFLYTNQEVFLVPQVDGGIGYGFGFGYRKGALAMEIQYNQTQHAVTFSGDPGMARMRMWSVNYKFFMIYKGPVQPYVNLGWVPGVSLKVFDASANISPDPDVSDARLVGNIWSSQIGLGMVFYPIRRLSLDAGFSYRFSKYTAVSSDQGGSVATIEDPLKGNGLNAFLSLNVVILAEKQ